MRIQRAVVIVHLQALNSAKVTPGSVLCFSSQCGQVQSDFLSVGFASETIYFHNLWKISTEKSPSSVSSERSGVSSWGSQKDVGELLAHRPHRVVLSLQARGISSGTNIVVSVEVNSYWGLMSWIAVGARVTGSWEVSYICQGDGFLRDFLHMPLSLRASRLVRQAYLARMLCLCCLGTLEMLLPTVVGWKSTVVALIHVEVKKRSVRPFAQPEFMVLRLKLHLLIFIGRFTDRQSVAG